MKKSNRNGEIATSCEGYEMKIIKYNNAHDIVVEFQDKYKTTVHAEYKEFKKGSICNPYHPSVCNIGYIGNTTMSINRKRKRSYVCWTNMIKRCCSNDKQKYPNYKDCKVCDEWLCYENFEKWWNNNYYEVDDEKMNLDKDILIKNNKIYSPETCIIVPARINMLFVSNKGIRGELPIGVYYDKIHSKYAVHCKINNIQKTIGYKDTLIEAFELYKITKEKEIKRVAEEYKNKIPKRLYDAMYNYEISISD